MKLAITGSSGFIGRKFLARHQHAYERISLLSRQSESNHDNLKFFNGSLSNAEALTALTRDADAVLHCAFDNRYAENVQGLSNLLESCRKNGVRRLIHLSSYVVYDFRPSNIDETTALSRRKDIYTREKIRLETLLRETAESSCSILAVQPTVVFGPGGSWSAAMFQAVKHSQIKLSNRGKNACNAIYIDDLVDRLHELIHVPDPAPLKFQILSNIHTTWREFLQFHADVLRQNNYPVNTFEVTGTNPNAYAESSLKNAIFSNSGVFPWKQLLSPLIRRTRDQTRTDLTSPITEGPFAFSGTARLCQSFSHQVHSLSPIPVQPLTEWLTTFARTLS